MKVGLDWRLVNRFDVIGVECFAGHCDFHSWLNCCGSFLVGQWFAFVVGVVVVVVPGSRSGIGLVISGGGIKCVIAGIANAATAGISAGGDPVKVDNSGWFGALCLGA